MKRHVASPQSRLNAGRVHIRHAGNWFSRNRKLHEVAVILLACLLCYLIIVLLSAIRVNDYSNRLWPLFG